DQSITSQIQGINHIAIASKDLQRTRWFFSEVLQLQTVSSETVACEGVHTTCLASANDKAATQQPMLELLSPLTPASTVAKFIQRRGAGVHHLAFNVKNVRLMASMLQAKGVQLINREPRAGANNTLVLFVHPKSTGGILVEFVQCEDNCSS
ncbi:MAG: VOC family protein, partial [Pseudomonadota bacterium]|nr:VOC family protein [Pseudomonadota bacterium]